MSLNPSHRVSLRMLVAPLALALIPAAGWAGGDWVEYTNETATRIVAASGLALTDPEEKDFASGDLDRDGATDLVVVRKLPFTNAGPRRNVLFMNENGVMTDRTDTLAPDFLQATDDRNVEVVDVDGDGWLDVVTAGTFGEMPRVLMNLGDDIGGTWLGLDHDPARIPSLPSGPKFCGLAAGDVTGDGFPDLYFTDYDNTLEDRLFINDGTGFFSDQTALRLTAGMVSSVFGTDAEIVDVNGDGFNDIVKNNASGSNPPGGFGPNVSVLYNDGIGNFVFRDEIYTDSGYMIAPADFTQDGRVDFFVVDDSQDSYLINLGNDLDGRAEFSTHTVTNSSRTNFFGGNTKFADLDGDGILDVLVADVDTDIPGCGRQLAALRGQGTPPAISYSDPLNGQSRPWLATGTFDVEPLHIDRDGNLDLWIGTCTGTLVFMGIGPGIFLDGFESGNTVAWSAAVP